MPGLLIKSETWSTNKVITIIDIWSDNLKTSQLRGFHMIFRGQGEQGFWRWYPSSWFQWLFWGLLKESIYNNSYVTYYMSYKRIDLNLAWKCWQDYLLILETHRVDGNDLFHSNQLRHTCSPYWILSITSDCKISPSTVIERNYWI